MGAVFWRTAVIYALLTGAMRIMGKRQIGQLDVSDLVSTLLISEIAAFPIENPSEPLYIALIPIAAVTGIEILSAYMQCRFPKLKTLFSVRPSVLIEMGQPKFDELKKARISSDELMVALRRAGVCDPDEVGAAILEQDGSVSVIPKASCRPATASDVGAACDEGGIYHIVVDNGTVNKNSLAAIGKDEKWLAKKAPNLDATTLMLADAQGNVRIYKSDGTRS